MRRLFLALILSIISFGIFAQDDLMNIINQDSTREINYFQIDPRDEWTFD